MASTSRKRPKTQNPYPHSAPRSSSSSIISQSSILEPSSNFFPSSISDLLRLVVVVSIAASVAVFCNYVATPFNQHPAPFCDSGVDFDDSFSGELFFEHNHLFLYSFLFSKNIFSFWFIVGFLPDLSWIVVYCNGNMLLLKCRVWCMISCAGGWGLV